MPNWPVRFLHASDFHLEQPLRGLQDVPESLRDTLVDAPYSAVRRVFDAAIEEHVDFVVLSGNLIDAQEAGPYALLFLHEQFERLHEQQIPIYWACGETESRSDWPQSVALPPNVHRFAMAHVEEQLFTRHDEAVARIEGIRLSAGASIPLADFTVDPNGLFTVGVAHGSLDPSTADALQIGYMALGGEHARRTVCSAPQWAQYSGSPQGRNPDQTGPHGCTLVEVDDLGQVSTRLIVTDTVRFLHETIGVDSEMGRRQLESRIESQIRGLIESATHQELLVTWIVQGSGPLVASLRHGPLGKEMRESLNRRYGHQSPQIWSLALRGHRHEETTTDAQAEETILGDFQRLVAEYMADSQRKLDVTQYLPDGPLAAAVAKQLGQQTAAERKQLLLEVAELGADLLGGEPPATGLAEEART